MGHLAGRYAVGGTAEVSMGKVRIRVSREFLAELLSLPDRHEIMAARTPSFGDYVEFLVSGPGLPECLADDAPLGNVIVTRHEDTSEISVV